MIRHDGWSHMIVTLNDLRVNLVVMHCLISYRDSKDYLMHRQGGGNLREGEHRCECRRRRNERLLRQKGLYHIMLL